MRIVKSLKINQTSPEHLKLISWDDFIRLYLIFDQNGNELQSDWKIDFWFTFFDPFNRGSIPIAEFTDVCGFLTEQCKAKHELLTEQTTQMLRHYLKDYFDENNNFNSWDFKCGLEMSRDGNYSHGKSKIDLMKFVQ